jgi:hypothetical protein
MRWEELLHMPTGEEVAYDPEELSLVQPMIALSETIRPVQIAVVRFPPGDDFLFSLLYDRTKDAYQKRARYRYASGRKEEFPPGPWVRLRDSQILREEKEHMIRDLAQIAEQTSGTLETIDLAPEATDEEVLDAFIHSGAFDVARVDQDTKRAKKLA